MDKAFDIKAFMAEAAQWAEAAKHGHYWAKTDNVHHARHLHTNIQKSP